MRGVVLLSTFNGEAYLREQLDSLLAQTLPGLEILVRDDGSTDGTCAILKEYVERGALRWDAGDNCGPARSFWRLLQSCGEADYYAFCDQDDIWDKEKLALAVRTLKELDGDKPALYCGDVRVTDAAGRIIAGHMVQPAPTDYAHALIRNLAPGCTFVFNRQAKELLCAYDAEQNGLELHDWTAYQIVACFGRVVFDPVPHMSYRQHENNVIGAHRPTMYSKLSKIPAFWSGPMKNSRERQSLRLEKAFGETMPPENRQLTAMLAQYRTNKITKQKLLQMLWRMRKSTDHRLAWLLALTDRL